MKTFTVEIKETLVRLVEVQAHTIGGALSQVEAEYAEEKIVLDAEDYVSTEINPYYELW